MTLTPPAPPRQSYQKHRQQLLRQIIIPLVFSGLLALGLLFWSAWAAFAPQGSSARGAAIAIIWLSLLALPGMLLLLGLLGAAVYGMRRLLRRAPAYTGQAQTLALRYNALAQKWVKDTTSALIRIAAWLQIFKQN